MLRNFDLNKYTDGCLYHQNDMVKLGCKDCQGCSFCCRDMEALVLDPYDIAELKKGLSMDFENLLEHGIILRLIDGLLLPVMDTQAKNKACAFLNEEGRCSIHSFRPGICRLFPLARYYHDDTFSYILQSQECRKHPSEKIKIRHWLGIPSLKAYERFVLIWHDFLKEIKESLPQVEESQERILHLYLLKTFYQEDYLDFYQEVERKIAQSYSILGLR